MDVSSRLAIRAVFRGLMAGARCDTCGRDIEPWSHCPACDPGEAFEEEQEEEEEETAVDMTEEEEEEEEEKEEASSVVIVVSSEEEDDKDKKDEGIGQD